VDRTVGPQPRQTPVAIAIGSNLGDRRAALDFAIARLSLLLTDRAVSDAIETDPEDADGAILADHPLYLNAVVTGVTTLAPRPLLEALLEIERQFGRERPYAGAPRTLDLDLILYGDDVVDETGLQVPHPRFRARFFVLGPLAEIAPAMRDPVTGLRVSELLRRLLRDEER
jgi:2-amino-4-hydroxy-6-hydroxymethyldihydropteridine diphosphokinase